MCVTVIWSPPSTGSWNTMVPKRNRSCGHNTHIGDARWTDIAPAGMVSVGQLVRETHADDGVIAIGFGCHVGT